MGCSVKNPPPGFAALAYSPSERGRAFVLQMASRREANRELSRPAFLATLQALFPERESLPHADTRAAAIAGDRGPGLGRDACGVAAALDPQQEIPSLLDQPVLPDCHRWDAEARALRPVVGGGMAGTTSGDGRRRIGASSTSMCWKRIWCCIMG